MLTRGDDYPLHQTPEPVAFSGTDRNFYDRYFFNGYHKESGDNFFAVALGVYPNLNVMDASFCVIHKGVQHNLHASRALGMERMDTSVGPITIEVVEPLKTLRVHVDDPERGIAAELTFQARCMPYKEPRFTFRQGPRTLFDYTRLTQNGAYTGWIEIEGDRIEIDPENYVGTRDRSWGIRPVGEPDPQPVLPIAAPQFFWLWASVNYPDSCSFFALNESAQGQAWHSSAALISTDATEAMPLISEKPAVAFKPGTRHAEGCELLFRDPDDHEIRVELRPQFNFYMSGLGYMHPEWGHGMYKGEIATGYEAWNLNEIDETLPLFLHVQAFCNATMSTKGETIQGSGVLEQLIIGPHERSGFKDFLDGYEPG